MLTPLVVTLLVAVPPPIESALKACTLADAKACHRLAEHLLHATAERRFTPALEAGCAKKVPDACAGLGLWTLRRPTPDEAQGLKQLDAACEQGSSVACAGAVEHRVRRTADAAERRKLVVPAEARCEKLGGSVCHSVASAYAEGWGVAVDAKRGTALASRACETGSSYACFTVARNLVADGGIWATPTARPLVQRACDGGIVRACHFAGTLLVDGVGLVKDVTQGVALVRYACEHSEAEACDYLAETNEGRAATAGAAGAFEDDAEKLRVSRKYCELGGADACARAAEALAEQSYRSGKLEGIEEALGLLHKACSRGSVRGCKNLGHAGKASVAQCEEGKAEGCFFAGLVYARGVSVPAEYGPTYAPDATKARAAFAKACAGGQRAACARAR